MPRGTDDTDLPAGGAPPAPSRFATRAATAADIPALARIKREAASRAYTDQVGEADLAAWLASSCDESFFRYRVGRRDYYVLVALDASGEVVGYGGFRQRGQRADGSSVGLYVASPGQGAGSALSDARERLARQLGCTRIRAACWRTNAPAHGFFEARGFERTGSGFRESTVGVMVDHYERDLA